jgi:hypothetical protein
VSFSLRNWKLSLNKLIKNAVFWDVTPCRPCVNRRFGWIYRLNLQGRKHSRVRNQHEQVVADWATETSVHTSSTLRHIPEDYILHSHRRENFKSYKQTNSLGHLKGEVVVNKTRFQLQKKKPQGNYVTKTRHSIFPRERASAYSENQTEPINKLRERNDTLLDVHMFNTVHAPGWCCLLL